MAIRFNEDRYRFVFRSRSGPVGRHLGRMGVRVESAMKQIATEEQLVRSGRYRASLTWRVVNRGFALVLEVGSALPIARLIERGSPVHIIAARRRVVNALGNITAPGREGGLWWTHGVGRVNRQTGTPWLVPGHPLQVVHHPGTIGYHVIARAVRRVFKSRIVIP